MRATCGSSKGSTHTVGYDDAVLPRDKARVKTNIQIALPSGCCGTVVLHSGLVVKHFRVVGAGVIDEDYRGNVGVVLFNFGKEKFEGMLNISNHINVMSFLSYVLNMSK